MLIGLLARWTVTFVSGSICSSW